MSNELKRQPKKDRLLVGFSASEIWRWAYMEVPWNIVNKHFQAVAYQTLSSKARAYYTSAADDEISKTTSFSKGHITPS